MKVIRVTTFLNFGGIEKRLINISNYSDKNLQQIFIAINHGGVAEKEIRRNNKKVYCLNLPYRIPSWKTIFKIYSLLTRERPDVVHASGAEANFHAIIAARLARVPVLVSEEIGIPSQSWLSKRIFSFIHSLSHVVIGNATQVVEYLQTENNVNPEKLRLVHNPVLFPALNNRVDSTKKFILISVCRLEPVKNLDTIINNLPELINVKPNLEYWILGEGAMKEELQRLAVSLDLEDKVKFIGFQPNVTDYLLQANLFILPSFSEGFSNALVEAMYTGMPCVATSVGGASEIIHDRKNGFLLDPNNSSQIMSLLKEVVLMPNSELREIGLKGKEHVLKSYSLEQHMHKLLNIYKETLEKNSSKN